MSETPVPAHIFREQARLTERVLQQRDEARDLLQRSHDLMIHHTKEQQCHCAYRGKCEVCLARELISDLHKALGGGMTQGKV